WGGSGAGSRGGATAAIARWKSSPPRTGGRAIPTRCCASASSDTRAWCDVRRAAADPLARPHAEARRTAARLEAWTTLILRDGRSRALLRIPPQDEGGATAMTTYDGIILGAGHNGLILQAYLGKAGLKTLAIERGASAGGGLSTIEAPRRPGFLHNTHAFFLRAVTAMPWYADLELARRGAQLIEPELNVALITSDGRALEWWTDIGKTIDSFAAFSRRDAATLRRWHDEFAPIVPQTPAPEARSPPLPPEARRALLSRTRAGRRLLAVSALSPLEFVEREFEHPTIKAGLLFFNGLREVDLRLPG